MLTGTVDVTDGVGVVVKDTVRDGDGVAMSGSAIHTEDCGTTARGVDGLDQSNSTAALKRPSWYSTRMLRMS
jgi:hypothetical protein